MCVYVSACLPLSVCLCVRVELVKIVKKEVCVCVCVRERVGRQVDNLKVKSPCPLW